MDTAVLDHGLPELLALPHHFPATPDISPRARAVADHMTAVMWSLPPDKVRPFVALAEAYVARVEARRQQRREEEMRDPPPAA